MNDFTISNNKLSGKNVKQFDTTKKSPGVNEKEFIVVHYTASGSFDEDVRTLSSSNKQVSCHIVIGLDGAVAMIGDFDDIQWHAGASQWKGINGLNRYSIGIEMTNPGWMELSQDRKSATTYYGKRYPVDDPSGQKPPLVLSAHQALGSKVYAWLPYTQQQLTALMNIVEVLKDAYPSIKEVVGHEQISPGRKQDPGIGIIFPQKLLDKLNGIGDDRSDDFYTGTDDEHVGGIYKDESEISTFYNVRTNGSALRIRKSNGSNSEVIGSLNNGDKVTIRRVSNGFGELVSANGKPVNGFVSMTYLK